MVGCFEGLDLDEGRNSFAPELKTVGNEVEEQLVNFATVAGNVSEILPANLASGFGESGFQVVANIIKDLIQIDRLNDAMGIGDSGVSKDAFEQIVHALRGRGDASRVI